MPFERLTLEELRERAETEIESRLGLGPLHPRSTAAAFARLPAIFAHHCLGYVDYLLLQVFPQTAEGSYLEQLASLRDISRKSASAAQGDVELEGIDGNTLPAGSRMQRGDGWEYSTDTDATIVSGAASVGVTAVDLGADGNAPAGTQLTLTSPISGIGSLVTVGADGLTGGADVEDDEDLRARLLSAWRDPPQGGAEADYVAAALTVPGVTRAFALGGHFGAGTVGVTVLLDDDPVSPVPSQAVLDLVQTAIDEIRPVGADAVAFAPGVLVLSPLVSVTPDTQAVRANIEQALEEQLLADAAPGATIRVSRLREAISRAVGERYHNLNYPTADVETAAGQIVLLGTVVYGARAQTSLFRVGVRVNPTTPSP